MRVISHTCSNTEIVCALGLQDYLIAVDDHSDFPKNVVNSLPKTGKDLNQDIEFIQSLKPDLVLTSLTVPGHEKIVNQLSENNVPNLVLDPTSIEQVMDNFVTIADALGDREKGLKLKYDFKKKLVELAAGITKRKLKVMVEWWSKPSIVPCQQSWVTDLIELGGNSNPWANFNLKSKPLTDQEVFDADPDLIILSWCGVDFKKINPEAVYRRKGWSKLKAIKNKNIFVISEEYLGRPGPRLLTGFSMLLQLTENIHVN